MSGFNSALRAVRLLREELQLLQEPGSYVGEVAKVSMRCHRLHFYPAADSSASEGRWVYLLMFAVGICLLSAAAFEPTSVTQVLTL